MENTTKNKENFLKQYLFTYTCFEGIGNSLWYLIPCTLRGCMVHLGNKGETKIMEVPPLELISLTYLKDEDAIEVGRLNGSITSNDKLVGQSMCHSLNVRGTNRDIPFEAIDYLRLKGYAIPYNGISVEKQVEYGWIKLKKR